MRGKHGFSFPSQVDTVYIRWHSHSNHQRSDGLYGAFIIHKPTSFSEDVPETSADSEEEHLIMVGDWYHRTAEEMVGWYRSKKSLGWVCITVISVVLGADCFQQRRNLRQITSWLMV